MKNKGVLYIISGPSGVGKGTICRLLIERIKDLSVSVSATTRKPRTEDTEGVTYFFKDREEFEEMIKNDELYEYIKARVEGHSFTESLPEEEIAILEKANAADMSEEEYMEQLDEVLAPNEEE